MFRMELIVVLQTEVKVDEGLRYLHKADNQMQLWTGACTLVLFSGPPFPRVGPEWYHNMSPKL